jgi:ribosomal protein S18 acetylase RimI-like enzyme
MNGKQVNIRLVRAEDIPDLIELWSKAELSTRPQGRDAPEALHRQLRAMGRHFWLAECDGRIVGCVLGTHDSRKGWINRLAVDPQCRRQGVAAALMAYVERSLAEDGIEIFAALVEEDNDVSRRFFTHQGYEEYPAYYYRKRLRDSV